jgi:hypothetical protein
MVRGMRRILRVGVLSPRRAGKSAQSGTVFGLLNQNVQCSCGCEMAEAKRLMEGSQGMGVWTGKGRSRESGDCSTETVFLSGG